MPGEKRPERLQWAPLRRDVLGRISGEIGHINAVRTTPSAMLEDGLPVGDRSSTLITPALQAGAR